MSVVDLVMPKLGESIMEATILKWHKKPGDSVKQDETVLDIATDKVDSEVPSTAEGVIESILFSENDVVPIGTVIATIRVGANAAVSNNQPAPAPQPQYEEAKLVEEIPYTPTATIIPPAATAGVNKIRFYGRTGKYSRYRTRWKGKQKRYIELCCGKSRRPKAKSGKPKHTRSYCTCK